MTQALSKQSPSLVVVNRNSKVPASSRAPDDVAELGRGEPVTPAVGDAIPVSDAFAAFVFEEVSGTGPLAPAREPAPPPPPRNTETQTDLAAALPRAVNANSAAPAPRTSVAPKTVARASSTPVTATSPVSTPATSPVTAPAMVQVSAPVTSQVSAAAPQLSREPEPKPPVSEVRPSSVAPATTATQPASVRADLDLRAKLNQKEAELLALRGELSLRDRLVLDLNNASLEIERSRTELSEQLEQTHTQLADTLAKLKTFEADKEVMAKRIEDMKLALRRSEDGWKRKNEADLSALRAEHATQLAELAAVHTAKLERIEQEKSEEIARLHVSYGAAADEAKEKHAEAIRSVETASSKALANAVSSYTRKLRALQDMQEQAMSKAALADAAKLEAAMAVATSDKASALAEADSALRAAQNDLAATRTTVEFLQGAHAGQLERVAQQEAKIGALEEALRRETARAVAAADTLVNLRRAFAAGLNLLNAPVKAADGE